MYELSENADVKKPVQTHVFIRVRAQDRYKEKLVIVI
jgi:hypothetical protein